MTKVCRKHSFSLIEVMISLTLLLMASVPLMHDVITRAKAYQDMNEKITGEIEVEEVFFSELAWMATSEDASFAKLAEGYTREISLGSNKRILTEFIVVDAPEDEALKARLGQLSVELYLPHRPEGPYIARSLLIAFEEKSL